MRNNKYYLQKMFFLLVMGFSLSCVCVAYGNNDDNDEPFTGNTGGSGTDNGNNNDTVNPSAPDDAEAVDLGLSVKWATCNVGASSPEEYGDYYAWGETTTKSEYFWSNYKWCNGSYNSMTKYCTSSSYGTVDHKTVLDLSDDVAHVKWGSNWRMPTLDEIKELRNNCTWEWTSQNGVNGMLVTGSNGNCIFLPATGDCFRTNFRGRGSYGSYWSATLDEFDSRFACDLDFDEGYRYWYYGYRRSDGHTVRPVCD